MDKKQFRLGGGSGSSGGDQRKSRFKSAGFIALLLLFGFIVFAAFNQTNNLKEVPFSQVIQDANAKRLKTIEISGNELKVTPQGQAEPTEKSYKEDGSSIYEQGLQQGKVEIINSPKSGDNLWILFLTSVLPVVIIAAILILMF